MFAGRGYGATRERSQHVNMLIGMIHLRGKISAGERGRIIDTLSFSGQPRAGLSKWRCRPWRGAQMSPPTVMEGQAERKPQEGTWGFSSDWFYCFFFYIQASKIIEAPHWMALDLMCSSISRVFLIPLLSFPSSVCLLYSLPSCSTSDLLLLYHMFKHPQLRPLNRKEKKVPFKLTQVGSNWTLKWRAAWNLATSGTLSPSRRLCICSFLLSPLLPSSAHSVFAPLHLWPAHGRAGHWPQFTSLPLTLASAAETWSRPGLKSWEKESGRRGFS